MVQDFVHCISLLAGFKHHLLVPLGRGDVLRGNVGKPVGWREGAKMCPGCLLQGWWCYSFSIHGFAQLQFLVHELAMGA